jgi:hypothetical protein
MVAILFYKSEGMNQEKGTPRYILLSKKYEGISKSILYIV